MKYLIGDIVFLNNTRHIARIKTLAEDSITYEVLRLINGKIITTTMTVTLPSKVFDKNAVPYKLTGNEQLRKALYDK